MNQFKSKEQPFKFYSVLNKTMNYNMDASDFYTNQRPKFATSITDVMMVGTDFGLDAKDDEERMMLRDDLHDFVVPVCSSNSNSSNLRCSKQIQKRLQRFISLRKNSEITRQGLKRFNFLKERYMRNPQKYRTKELNFEALLETEQNGNICSGMQFLSKTVPDKVHDLKAFFPNISPCTESRSVTVSMPPFLPAERGILYDPAAGATINACVNFLPPMKHREYTSDKHIHQNGHPCELQSARKFGDIDFVSPHRDIQEYCTYTTCVPPKTFTEFSAQVQHDHDSEIASPSCIGSISDIPSPSIVFSTGSNKQKQYDSLVAQGFSSSYAGGIDIVSYSLKHQGSIIRPFLHQDDGN